ncbi:MAG TPA: hypothetical protein VH331_05330 [Allosphingosinicella sp.]|nr:hypothetical protein [Allosphingosinicella sp.]
MILLVAALLAQAPTCSLEVLHGDSHACDAAIEAAPQGQDKAELFYTRAYASNEAGRFADALGDLDHALAVEPNNPKFLHERGYTLGALGSYRRALADLDREVVIRPTFPDAYEERSYARRRLGDFAGAYADRAEAVRLKPGDADALLDRSHAALWIGRFDQVRADAAAAAGASNGNAAVVQRAARLRRAAELWSGRSGTSNPAKRCDDAMKEDKLDAPDVIGDCTAAFFAATTPAEKADALTVRSLAWAVGQQDEKSWLEDGEMAVAIDPGNSDWHANLGGIYVHLGRMREGLAEFERAVSIKPSVVALAGRARAKYELGDKAGAFADAKGAFEIKPNPIALDVLGELAHDRKDDKSAKLYWMGAYHLGLRGDELIAELKSVGVDHPEKEPKQ